MDSHSGRFPLDLFPFYLDMSSENALEETTTTPSGTGEHEQPAKLLSTVVSLSRAVSQEAFTPSPSTKESVSAYVERTLQELGPQHEIRFLPPTETELTVPAPEQEVPKASVSDAIVKPIGGDGGHSDGLMEVETQEEEMSEVGRFKLRADYFQTDTSEIEDLYDSAGADTTTPALLSPLSWLQGLLI